VSVSVFEIWISCDLLIKFAMVGGWLNYVHRGVESDVVTTL
jgi:hypothetical protein